MCHLEYKVSNHRKLEQVLLIPQSMDDDEKQLKEQALILVRLILENEMLKDIFESEEKEELYSNVST